MDVLTKTEFAKLCNVSAGRVSQWIAEGKISGALIGEGRQAKIDVAKARAKLKLRIDPAQRRPETKLGETDSLDLKLKQAKLTQAEALNRRASEEELARRGVYVRAEHASAEAGKLASTILQMFEGGLTDVAAEIAAEFKLPQRDLVHLMRKRFREVRAKISARLANEALALPPTIDDSLTD